MEKGSNWGKCPLRRLGWAEKSGVILGWSYICGKNHDICDPDYCLGPDEDGKSNEKETDYED